MARRRWVRLDVNYDEQDWMEGLADHVRRLYPSLLCHVKAKGVRGAFKRSTPDNMGRALRCDPGDWLLLLNAALAKNAITINDDGDYEIAEWKDTQEFDKTAPERKARWKERHAND